MASDNISFSWAFWYHYFCFLVFFLITPNNSWQGFHHGSCGSPAIHASPCHVAVVLRLLCGTANNSHTITYTLCRGHRKNITTSTSPILASAIGRVRPRQTLFAYAPVLQYTNDVELNHRGSHQFNTPRFPIPVRSTGFLQAPTASKLGSLGLAWSDGNFIKGHESPILARGIRKSELSIDTRSKVGSRHYRTPACFTAALSFLVCL